MIAIAEETSGFRRTGLSPVLWLLIPTFSLPVAPAHFTVYLHSNENAPLPLGDFKERSTLALQQASTDCREGLDSNQQATGESNPCFLPLKYLRIYSLFEITEPTLSVLCLAPLHFRRILPHVTRYRSSLFLQITNLYKYTNQIYSYIRTNS